MQYVPHSHLHPPMDCAETAFTNIRACGATAGNPRSMKKIVASDIPSPSLLRAAGARCAAAARPWLDVLYPPCCVRCGDRIRAEDVLCPSCMADMVPFPVTEQSSEEHLAALRFRAAATMMSVGYEFEIDGSVSACIHTMKYRGMHRVARWLGRLIGEQLAGSDVLRGEPTLVPVPLHAIKRIERGFNQAEEICRGIAQETGLPVVADAVRRVRYTQSQAAMKLHVEERKSNVSNAFTINPQRIAVVCERPVLLVDDLITTGATMSECASALREQGAREVRYAAVARPPA
jgi:ComF family protein